MKKFKKITAAVISTVIAASAAGTLSAAAIENPLVYPEGYTECMVGKNSGSIIYIKPSTGDIITYTETMYNNLMYEFSDNAPENAYDLYFDDIYSTGYNSAGYAYYCHVKGDDPRTHESIPDIYDKLKEKVDYLYKEGLIKTAYFAPMTASINSGSLGNSIIISGSEITESELRAVTDKYEKDCKITFDEYKIKIQLYSLNTEEKLKLRKEIDDLYEWDNVSVDYETTCLATYPETFMFNMLDPYICDIDGNGKVDISDASQILANYSKKASGILKAAETDPMDVNSDGAADAQDASYILSCYAETAA
ncbi:MAG: dockerin type I domain-containing protein, partial [Ruminococcus sp.]